LIRTCLFLYGVLLLAGTPMAADSVAVWKALMASGINAITAKNYATAEEQIQKALGITAQFPPGDARIGTTLNTLGLIYREERKYPEAQKAFEKTLVIFKLSEGADSLNVGNVNFNIASVLMAEDRYDDALPYVQKSQAIYLRILGPQSLKAASVLCMTGEVYRHGKKFQAAEAPLKECANAREATEGMESADFGDALYSLGLVYAQEGRWALADSTLKLTEKVRELTLGVTSQEFADALEAHSGVLKSMKREPEAVREDAMAAAIRRVGKKTK
jgi:tetratricopeptide (TPR) repeat protein